MHHHQRRRTWPAIALLSLAAACSRDTTRILNIVPPVADAEGRWRVEGTIVNQSCSPRVVDPELDAVLDVDQSEELLAVEAFDLCGDAAWSVSGLIDTDGTISLTSNVTVDLGDGCLAQLRTEITGNLDGDVGHFDRLDYATLTPACGVPQGSCFAESTYTATRCPPGDCTFDPC